MGHDSGGGGAADAVAEDDEGGEVGVPVVVAAEGVVVLLLLLGLRELLGRRLPLDQAPQALRPAPQQRRGVGHAVRVDLLELRDRPVGQRRESAAGTTSTVQEFQIRRLARVVDGEDGVAPGCEFGEVGCVGEAGHAGARQEEDGRAVGG